jgi:hypothetical protein
MKALTPKARMMVGILTRRRCELKKGAGEEESDEVKRRAG